MIRSNELRRRAAHGVPAKAASALSATPAQAANWMALNWPESTLSFTSAYACTRRGAPATNPSRQPVML